MPFYTHLCPQENGIKQKQQHLPCFQLLPSHSHQVLGLKQHSLYQVGHLGTENDSLTHCITSESTFPGTSHS